MIRINYFCFGCGRGWTRFTATEPDLPRCRFHGCSNVVGRLA